jgi:hypothetical protein
VSLDIISLIVPVPNDLCLISHPIINSQTEIFVPANNAKKLAFTNVFLDFIISPSPHIPKARNFLDSPTHRIFRQTFPKTFHLLKISGIKRRKGLAIKKRFPFNLSRCADIIFAAPRRMAMWASCPQACMWPLSAAKGRPVSSLISSASRVFAKRKFYSKFLLK